MLDQAQSSRLLAPDALEFLAMIERDRSNEAFRVTAAGEAALKAKLPLTRVRL